MGQWEGDNGPFKAMEADVENALKLGKSDGLIKEYRALAEKKPHQPLDVFRWVYASYRATEAMSASTIKDNLYEPHEAMLEIADAASPHTYEFARLLFLVESYFYNQLLYPSEKKLGNRLLQRNPKDLRVQLRMCSVLVDDPKMTEARRAVDIAKSLIAASPKSAARYGWLGNVYYNLWWRSPHADSDRKSAAAAYRKILELAPKGDPLRPLADKWSKLLDASSRVPLRKP